MLKLWLTALTLAGLAMFAAGAWRAMSSFRFSLESTVLPGTFLEYIALPESTGWLGNSHPRFEVRFPDGSRRVFTGKESHLFRGLEAGASIPVLVHRDSARTPRIHAFGSLYAFALILLLVGGGVFLMTLGEVRSASSWDRAISGRGDPEVEVPGPEGRPTRGARTAPAGVAILILVSAGVLGTQLFLHRQGRASRAAGSLVTGNGSDGPRETTEVPAAGRRETPGSARGNARGLLEAARAGDHVALLGFLQTGSAVEDLGPSMVTYLAREDDADSLRVLLDFDLDPSGECGAWTLGDHAVASGSTDVVRLIRERGGTFTAPPQFVALVAGDEPALRAALEHADPEVQFTGSRLPHFARRAGQEELLRSVAPDLALPQELEPRSGHRSAAHAARAGDHVALAAFIEAGEDIADINPANLISPISQGQVETLRLLFRLDYPYDSYAGSTLGDHAVQHGQTAIVHLVQEYDREFWAAPQFVALIAGDEKALREALAQAGSGELFIGRSIDFWAEQHGRKDLLTAARSAP